MSPAIFPVIVRRTTVVQGGDLPAGAAVTTDVVSLFARVGVGDANPAPADMAAYDLAAAYADAVAGPTEALALGPRLPADASETPLEALALGPGLADAAPGQDEALSLTLAGHSEASPAPDETVRAGWSGYADAAPGQDEARTSVVTSWGAATTSSGTAPTNPGNATGPNDGATSRVKAGGLANGTSQLNVTVPRDAVPAGGAKVIRAWYRTAPAAVGDTVTVTYTATGGSPASLSLPAGDFLTTPHEAAITSIGGDTDPVLAFRITSSTPATGGHIDVDAVAIVTTGAF